MVKKGQTFKNCKHGNREVTRVRLLKRKPLDWTRGRVIPSANIISRLGDGDLKTFTHAQEIALGSVKVYFIGA